MDELRASRGDTSTEQVVNYADWTTRLHKYFFHLINEGRPITLFVDDEVLMEVHGGSDLQAAAASFHTAVRSWLTKASDGGPFDKIYREGNKWRRTWPSDSPSPALPLLAASVLAASRMAKSTGIAPTNYYVHFFPIVGLPKTLTFQNEYGATIPKLWEDMSEWIDRIQGGRLGQSTITRDDWFTRIGYALSQSLFRQSDRDRLPLFLKKMGLAPHSAIEGGELLPYFKRWAVNASLSSGAKRMIAAPGYDKQLAAMLVQAAALWDGTERDEEGRRLGRLAITLAFPSPRGSLNVIAERPRGFPEFAEFIGADGERWALRSSGGTWYDESPLALPADALVNGLSLRSGTQLSLRLPIDPVVPLRQNEELGCWVASLRLELGIDHYVLVRNDLLSLTRDTIKKAGGPEPEVAGSVANLPAGYTLLRDVLMMRMPSGTLPHELASLLPVATERPVLLGGLPLDLGPATYIRGGEPDVFISKTASDIASEYSVDGVQYDVPVGGGQLALSGLDLTDGAHSLVLGPTRISFYTANDLGRIVPKAAGSVGFSFTRERGEYRIQRAGAEVLEADQNADVVVVCGARVKGSPSAIPDGPRAPIVMPRGRRRYFVIGRNVGDIDEVPQPPPPAWLAGIPLYSTGFEYYPHFDSAWLLLEETYFWVARQVADEAGPQAVRPDRAAVRKWCGAVLSGQSAKVDGDSRLWLEYVLAAHDEAW